MNGHSTFKFIRDIILLGLAAFMLIYETLGEGRWEVMLMACIVAGLVAWPFTVQRKENGK